MSGKTAPEGAAAFRLLNSAEHIEVASATGRLKAIGPEFSRTHFSPYVSHRKWMGFSPRGVVGHPNCAIGRASQSRQSRYTEYWCSRSILRPRGELTRLEQS